MADEKRWTDRLWELFLALGAGLVVAIVGPVILLAISPLIQENLTGPSCDDPRGLVPVTDVSVDPAISTLPPQQGIQYVPNNLLDGDTSTAWVEGVSGDPKKNLGQGLSLKFTLPHNPDLQMICMVNGYAKSWTRFQQNATIRLLTVQTEAGTGEASGLASKQQSDYASFQTLNFPKGRTKTVTITIDSARAGTEADHFNDTAVSEIEFWAHK